MSSKARRKPIDHATAERFISPEQHARNLNRQEMWVGQKGEGKSVGMVQRLSNLLNKSDDKYTPKVAEITDDEMKEMYHAIEVYNKEKELETQNIITTGNTSHISLTYFPEMNTSVQASGNGGSGGSNNINYSPTSNQYPPNWWDNQQAPYYYSWETVPNTHPQPLEQQTPVKQEEKKKQEFKSEDYKGKFCAIVTLTKQGIEHIGILFVKKCGHWKLCKYNGDKVAGGTAGSFEEELKKGTLKITVHQTIYTDAPTEIGENELEIH